jgi:hypothetical protein
MRMSSPARSPWPGVPGRADRETAKCTAPPGRYHCGIDPASVVTRQLGRPPRAFRRVAARCPYGRPAAIEAAAYLDDGTPFPTTYYLTCPHAVARVSQLESAGGVARYERLIAGDPALRREWDDGAARQRAARRPAPVMRDGGASLALGIGGTARRGAVKCLHAHVAFALVEPAYRLGRRMADDAAPLFPDDGCCTP